MGQSMLRYGEFSELEWHLLDQMLQPGAIAIEAGANMGTFTVPMARKVGLNGMVYAFEPQLAVFQQLCANLALNDILNCQAFNAACGAATEWTNTIRPNPRTRNNYGGFDLDMLQADHSMTRVRVERLDDVLDIPRLTLLKADVEGMEQAVLEGAAGLIRTHRPLLYLEANHQDASALIAYVLGLDYRMYWHLPPMFNPDNYLKDQENLFPGIVSMNVFCIPAESPDALQGAREVQGPDDHPTKWKTG